MTLEIGAVAPTVDLPSSDGRASLDALIDRAAAHAVLAVFLKTTCPTCAFTVPLVAALGRVLGDAVATLAIAEDPLARATEWLRGMGYAGAVASDSYGNFRTGRRYRVGSLPTTLLIVGGTRTVDLTMEGWQRSRFNELAVRMAALAGVEPAGLSTPADGLPDRALGCWARARR